MHFLSKAVSKDWGQLAEKIFAEGTGPEACRSFVQSNFFSMFCFYIGVLFIVEKGDVSKGRSWFLEGTLLEQDGLFMNAFVTSFLERHNNKFTMPAVCFEDPMPYVHFTTTPIMQDARRNFITYCSHTLPVFKKPLKIMDIGTGNGTLLNELLKKLQKDNKFDAIEEILLIDASKAMIELATETISRDFDASLIKSHCSRIQDFSAKINGHYDIILSSLAYHHMPYEHKITHLEKMRGQLDHFIIFELDANNDTPDMNTPELACSIYQSYGRIIDYIFSHDAPVQVAENAVDYFLMTEAVSFLTQPRGVRTDYHMLRAQWHELFREGLGNEFQCRSEVTCHADEYLDLFALHYGRS